MVIFAVAPFTGAWIEIGKRNLLVKFTVETTEGDIESEFEFGGEAA